MATQTQELKKELKKTTDNAKKTVKDTVETAQKEIVGTAGDVKDAAQKVFLAGLGAFAVAEEEGSKLFTKLVKRGRKVELPGLGADRVKKISKQLAGAADDAQDAVKSRVESATEAAGETAASIEDRVQDAVATVMKRIGVPTRTEIAELTASVERLTAHVETLKVEKTTAVKAAKADAAAARADAQAEIEATEAKIQATKAAAKADLAAARAEARAAKAEAAKPAAVTMEAVGGGWYEIAVAGVVVEKVQGKEDAEAAVTRLQETQG